jgi:hypothetical protein
MNIEVTVKNIIDSAEVLKKTIEEQESTIVDLKNSKNVLSLLPYIQGTVYRPIKYFYKQPKCNKCDKNGFISVPDNFYSRHKVCECQTLLYKYEVQELKVISTSYIAEKDVKTYDCVLGEKDLISFNEHNLFDYFSVEQLELDDSIVFYSNIENCEEFCRRKNSYEKDS